MTNTTIPYFFDGRLHFPKTTLNALLKHGLEPSVARVVRSGVDLDDRQTMHQLYISIQSYLEANPANDAIAKGLADNEVQFMLTGLPSRR